MHEAFEEGEKLIHERRDEELQLERRKKALQQKTRQDVVTRYFSQKVGGAVHQKATLTDALNAWREGFLHEGYAAFHEEQKRRENSKREEEKKERAVHGTARGARVSKYFSEKVSPAVHDAAVTSECFGLWKEEFVHERRTKEHDLQKKLHGKARSSMLMK